MSWVTSSERTVIVRCYLAWSARCQIPVKEAGSGAGRGPPEPDATDPFLQTRFIATIAAATIGQLLPVAVSRRPATGNRQSAPRRVAQPYFLQGGRRIHRCPSGEARKC